MDSPYLPTTEAAAFVRRTARALEMLRVRGLGPRYFRVGRKVLYKLEDLTAWIESERATADALQHGNDAA